MPHLVGRAVTGQVVRACPCRSSFWIEHARVDVYVGAVKYSVFTVRSRMSDDNKSLIRRYIEAIDNNASSDWSVIDQFVAEDFVAHNPPIPGVTLDREGLKRAAEMFRVGTPGKHQVTMQIAEGDLVVSHINGEGLHAGELLGIPATNRPI